MRFGNIRLFEGGKLIFVKGNNTISIIPPSSITTSYELLLPQTTPAFNQPLVISPTGEMSYATLPEPYIEDVSGNPPWLDLPLSSGWSRFVNPGFEFSSLQIIKIGRKVDLKGTLVKAAPSVGELITPNNSIPVSCYPTESRIFTCCSQGASVGFGSFFALGTTNASASRTLMYVTGSSSIFFGVEASWHVDEMTALFYGDSITKATTTGITVAQRWSNLVAVSRGWREDNRGVDGRRFVSALGDPGAGELNYENDVIKGYPDYVFISFGVNDLISFGLTGANIIQAPNFKAALNRVVIDLKKYINPKKIVIQTPMYMNQSVMVPPYSDNYTVARHLDFNLATKEVAETHGCKWADTYTYMQANGGNSLLQSDGFHPTVAGHVVIKDCILNSLNSIGSGTNLGLIDTTGKALTSNLDIVYSNLEPPTNKQNYLWYELDSNNNQIHPYPWRWDVTKNKWQSPLKEAFFAYRYDYDAGFPLNGDSITLINIAWWCFPNDDNNKPTQIRLLNTNLNTSQLLFNVTTVNGVNHGESLNLNIDINANNNNTKVIELRFANNEGNPSGVWGNIKLDYILYR